MDAFNTAARGSRPRTFDRRRWADSQETVPTRTPVPGIRTRTRLKARHVVSGLAHDARKPAPDITPAAMQAWLENMHPNETRRPARVWTSADMPDLVEGASPTQIAAWGAERERLAHARGKILREATLDPYKSPMGDGPEVKLRRTAEGLLPE